MPRNIEIKARVASLALLEPQVAALADDGPVEIVQDDTFFHCADGRLKLRIFANGEGQLIHYRRPDVAGPKESAYSIAPVAEPIPLLHTLTLACGQRGRVCKRRTLYMIGRTRVHLDRVAGLGEFIELEVVLAETESAQSGEAEAHALLNQLGIAPRDLVETAYVDLMAT